MPTSYERLLADPYAHRILLVRIWTWDGSTETVWQFCDGDLSNGFNTDPDEGLADPYFEPRLRGGLTESAEVPYDQIVGGVVSPTYSELELDNRDGGLDGWRNLSVDARRVLVLLVGRLSDGTRIRYSDAVTSPVFDGLADGFPRGGEERYRVKLKTALHKLSTPAQPTTYSPPCLEFPGTSAGCVDWGDQFDQAGSFTFECWVYLTSISAGTIVSKDTGSAGWSFDIGTPGSGALRLRVREQSASTTDTATGVLQLLRWTHVAFAVDVAAGTRTIFVDGASVASTSSVTGSPAGNSASFKLGANLSGKLSEGRIWNTAKTATLIRNEMYLTQIATASGLTAYMQLSDGEGSTTADRKSGSTLTGSLGTGVAWSSADWAGSSIAGKAKFRPLGYCLDVEAVPVDPAKNIFQASGSSVVMVPAVRSNHNALSGASYTVDAARGLFTLTSAPGGKITNDVIDCRFGAALAYDGVSNRSTFGDTADQTSSFTLLALVRLDNVATSFGRIISKDDGSTGWILATGAASSRTLLFLIRGSSFVTSSATLPVGYWCHVAAVYDAAAQTMTLYRDGDQVGQVTGVTVGPVNTAHTLSVGARHDGASPFGGAIDEPVIIPRALSHAEVQYRVIHPWTSTEITAESGHGWTCNEGSGTSLAPLRSGDPSGTVVGATWTYSRTAHADLVASLLRSAGYARTDFDVASFAAHCRDFPGDAGWLVDSSTVDHEEVANSILRGCGSVLAPDPVTGKITISAWAAPTGTADHDVDVDLDGRQETIEEDEGIPGVAWRVEVLHARNYGPVGAESVAGIVTTQPERYQFATQEWRTASDQDFSVRGDYPTARTISIESAWRNRVDADAMARALLAIYKQRPYAYPVPLHSQALAFAIGDELSVTWHRLGMETGPHFRVLGYDRNGLAAEPKVWRVGGW